MWVGRVPVVVGNLKTYGYLTTLYQIISPQRSVAGEYDRSLSWLYVNASYRVKEMLSQHFKLEKPLYFSYTHLVCRTAKKGN